MSDDNNAIKPGTDEYTERYMSGEDARYVDKVRMPWWMNGLLLGAGVGGAVAAAASGAIVAPLIALGATAVAWTLLSTLRIVVTDDRVHVQYGLFGPKIPVDEIVSVDVADYSVVKYGGWGIRFGLDGSRAYSLPGRGGRVVRIKRRTKRGVRIVDLTSENPEALAAAIEAVRAGGGLAAARARQGLADAPARGVSEHEHEHEHEHEQKG